MPDAYDFLLETLPYTVTTQCQITIATILCCTTALPYFAKFIEHPSSTPNTNKCLNSSSSFDDDIASHYFALTQAPVILQPLPKIQASMAISMGSPHGSIKPLSAHEDKKPAKSRAPLRPLPPFEHQRPDLSMFTHMPKAMRPPPVTLLRKDRQRNSVSEEGGDAVGRVKTRKQAKFNI